jgi:hypothetical protein
VGTSVKGNFYVEDNTVTNPPRLFDVNADNNTVTVGAATQAVPLTVNGALTAAGAVKINAATDSTGKDTGALVVGGGVGIGKAFNVGGAVTVEGGIFPAQHDWEENETPKTQNDWFLKFEEIIPIGKRLQINGWARIRSVNPPTIYDTTITGIRRIDNDTIEINSFPFSWSLGSSSNPAGSGVYNKSSLKAMCERGNSTIVSERICISW